MGGWLVYWKTYKNRVGKEHLRDQDKETGVKI